MKQRVLLLICAAAALSLPMCQEFDGPPRAGTMLAVDPVADGLMAQAKSYAAAGKTSKALSCLKRLVQDRPLAPNAAQARYMMGELYEAKREYRDAFKQYGRVIEQYQSSPLYSQALNRQLALALGAANGKLKTPVLWGAWSSEMESDTVEEWLRSIISHAPYNDMSATANSILAKYLLEHRQPEKARAAYAELVENYPDSKFAPEAQLMLAKLWADERTRGNNNLVNINKAQEAYEEFSLRFPNHPDARKALAQASSMKRLLVQQELEVGRYYLERAREYTSAIFCFEDVLRQKAVNPEAAAEAQTLLSRARALQNAAKH